MDRPIQEIQVVPSKHIGMSDSDLEKFRPTEI